MLGRCSRPAKQAGKNIGTPGSVGCGSPALVGDASQRAIARR